MQTGAFSHAFKLAQLAAPHKLRHVHLNFAMFLEDSGRLTEAEGEFVAAGGWVIVTSCCSASVQQRCSRVGAMHVSRPADAPHTHTCRQAPRGH
jgi:hypothetical protein